MIALITTIEASKAKGHPFWVSVRADSGDVLNSGQDFATRVEVDAFIQGLDMMARLFGERCVPYLHVGPAELEVP